jgi:hypothetical protein
MTDFSIVLIHPPVAKPSEPPAGLTVLAGALKAHGIRYKAIDANVRGVTALLHAVPKPQDTWGRRAYRHLDDNLISLRTPQTYSSIDRYKRAVSDINRLLTTVGKAQGIGISLADYNERHRTAVRSIDLAEAARSPETNPFSDYFHDTLIPEIADFHPKAVGLSINFLSQGICAFALIGLLRRKLPEVEIIIGGGLVTSWLQYPKMNSAIAGWVDRMIAGPGETPLLEMAGVTVTKEHTLPDVAPFFNEPYLSPGRVLSYSASRGCWWRRCAFCPERAEQQPYRPIPKTTAATQLQALTRQYQPALIHLLDNAVSPALLKTLAQNPPGAPWYGFARIGAPLDAPAFCRQLAISGCIMLKLGLESGDQNVLNALEKGIRLEIAETVLHNLYDVGIATYVYLLFGTPAEDENAARRTMQFVADHHKTVGYLNTAIFNLPVQSPEAESLTLRSFYEGDMALYTDFIHPLGWTRSNVRRFVEKEFKRHPAIRPIVLRDPPIFTSNHAAFFHTQARFFNSRRQLGTATRHPQHL